MGKITGVKDKSLHDHLIILYNCWSAIMCYIVIYALFKTRKKWLKSGNTYVVLTGIIMIENAFQNSYLLVTKILSPTYVKRVDGHPFCTLEGITLVTLNLLNCWLLFFLSLESCLMIRFDLYQNKLKMKRSRMSRMSYQIVYKTHRLRTYLLFTMFVVVSNILVISHYHGFGTSTPNPFSCGIKANAIDEKKWMYHWVTVFSTSGILFLGIFTLYFIQSSSFKNYHIQLKMTTRQLFIKLLCLPLIFLVVNFVWFLKLRSDIVSDEMKILSICSTYSGSIMGGLLAAGIWGTNSFVRKHLNKKTFKRICSFIKCKCDCCKRIFSSDKERESKISLDLEGKNRLGESLLSEDDKMDIAKSIKRSLTKGGVDFDAYLNTSTSFEESDDVESRQLSELVGNDIVDIEGIKPASMIEKSDSISV